LKLKLNTNFIFYETDNLVEKILWKKKTLNAEKEGLVHSLNMLWEEGNSTQPILRHLWGTDMCYRFQTIFPHRERTYCLNVYCNSFLIEAAASGALPPSEN
jgi:hypothetical protein